MRTYLQGHHDSVLRSRRWRTAESSAAHDAEPDAGRRLLGWARSAGFADVVPSASAWCFATAEERSWWGGMQADRIVASRIAEDVVARRLSTAEELQDLAAGWRAWADAEDGWFAVLHGEVLCRVAPADDRRRHQARRWRRHAGRHVLRACAHARDLHDPPGRDPGAVH